MSNTLGVLPSKEVDTNLFKMNLAEGSDELKDLPFISIFIPRIVKGDSFPSYENFNVLIDRANQFLANNKTVEAQSCETITFRIKNQNDPLEHFEKLVFKKFHSGYTHFIKGLKLWLIKRKDTSLPPQKIGLLSIIPKEKKPKCFQTLNEVLNRFNAEQQVNPIRGRILRVETRKLKYKKNRKIDKHCSYWYEHNEYSSRYVFAIEVFYEIGYPTYDKIGIQDFIPDSPKRGIYESFTDVFCKASIWLSMRPTFRFCNAQTVEMPISPSSRGEEVFPQNMQFKPRCGKYIRLIRLVYTYPNDPERASAPPNPISLSHKSWIPRQFKAGIDNYETLIPFIKRIHKWVKLTGVRVIGAETDIMSIKLDREDDVGAESMVCGRLPTYEDNCNEYKRIQVVRLYFDRPYEDNTMIAEPVKLQQFSRCCIS